MAALQVLSQSDINTSSRSEIAAAACREVGQSYIRLDTCPFLAWLHGIPTLHLVKSWLSAQFSVVEGVEWTAAAGRAAVIVYGLIARGVSLREHAGANADFLQSKHPALLWSQYTLGRKSPAEIWAACARLLAARLLPHAGARPAAEEASAFAIRVLIAAPVSAHGDALAVAAICKPALQLLMTSCRQLSGHHWWPPEAACKLRTALDGLHRLLCEAAASASESEGTGLRPSVPGSVPGQGARAALHEATCWVLLAKAQCLGELGVASDLGEDMLGLLAADSDTDPDVAFVLRQGGCDLTASYTRPQPVDRPGLSASRSSICLWDKRALSLWLTCYLLHLQ